MKTLLSLLLLTMVGRTAFGEDLKIYAAAALKGPLIDVVSQYEAGTHSYGPSILTPLGPVNCAGFAVADEMKGLGH